MLKKGINVSVDTIKENELSEEEGVQSTGIFIGEGHVYIGKGHSIKDKAHYIKDKAHYIIDKGRYIIGKGDSIIVKGHVDVGKGSVVVGEGHFDVIKGSTVAGEEHFDEGKVRFGVFIAGNIDEYIVSEEKDKSKSVTSFDTDASRKYPITLEQARKRALRSIKMAKEQKLLSDEDE